MMHVNKYDNCYSEEDECVVKNGLSVEQSVISRKTQWVFENCRGNQVTRLETSKEETYRTFVKNMTNTTYNACFAW